MLVYRLYKSTYLADPLSAEGARRAGGRWNPKGVPILYTSATPELALLEVVAHLNPSFIPSFHLLVLDIPQVYRTIDLTDLSPAWPEADDPLPGQVVDWLKQPDTLTLSVPSAIVSRSRNFLLHTLYPGFGEQVTLVENQPFRLDARLIGGGI